MKKLIAFAIAFFIMFSFALADSPVEFVERWNKGAYVYGAPELTDYSKTDEVYIFTGEGWSVSLTYLYDMLFSKVEIFSESADQYLAMCAIAGIAALTYKTAEMMENYDANIFTNYLRIVSERDSRTAYLSNYKFKLEKVENGFLFLLGEW